MVAFGQKLRYFTDQNGPKGGPHDKEFWVFSNSEILQTFRSEKVDEKNGVLCLVFMFFSWVMVLKLSKKVHFCNFVLASARNLGLLKQFTYMYLEGLVMHFQKMVWFIMLWLTVLETLVFEIEKICSNSAESASFLIF